MNVMVKFRAVRATGVTTIEYPRMFKSKAVGALNW